MRNRADLLDTVVRISGAKRAHFIDDVQSLWGGYGRILRLELELNTARVSVIVKSVRPPQISAHQASTPAGFAHRRKLRSYEIEHHFYHTWAQQLDERCRVAQVIALDRNHDEFLFVLEDLDAAGFTRRSYAPREQEIAACLAWLASFHARFMGQNEHQLWPVGCYWHLETRPEEFEALSDSPLKAAASYFDRRLRNAQFQTLVHGDAKVENFCFAGPSKPSAPVAAVDFQYVGSGPGIRDVMYLLSSCLDQKSAASSTAHYLDIYFNELQQALRTDAPSFDANQVEAEWRELYAIAWADFIRFLRGWAGEHYKIHDYSLKLTEAALAQAKRDQR